MATYDLASRQARYFTLSSELAHLDNAQLRSALEASETQQGWGRNHVLQVAGSNVFVKRLPVTDLEYEHLFSTKNLYGLPPYYNYGVGSAGFGVFRELVANIKTTNWVLAGAIPSFPLLYHYRVIQYSGERPDFDQERLRGYVEYWNGDENIGRYMSARTTASYELVLLLEHLPYGMESWLLANSEKVDRVLADLRAAVTFLRSNGIVHFDANFDNVLSDGEQAYLTDFGLVLDQRFALSEAEATFLDQHTYYDYGEVLGSLAFFLYRVYGDLSESEKWRINEQWGLGAEPNPAEVMSVYLEHIGEIHAGGMLNLDASFVDTVVKYRSIITMFLDFFVGMRRSHKKDTEYPREELHRLLNATGFLADTN